MNKVAKREDVINQVVKDGIGIELGVAEGVFAERLLRTNRLSYLYGVDMYAGDRGHDVGQYKGTLKKLDPFRSKYTLIKMRFDQALDLFPDNYFDFIYIDGYAHTGEEEGQTLHDWFPKLKRGGVFAGDDYHEDWPLVVDAVDKFVNQHDQSLNIIECREPLIYCEYPTWYLIKN